MSVFRGFARGIAALLLLGMAVAAAARERGPRVDVICPMAPIPVRLDQQQVLVYELHVTNFDVVPLVLTRVEVFANEVSGASLGVLTDKKLADAMITVGAKPHGTDKDKEKDGADARTIEPGVRAVVYLWIALPPQRSTPTSLRHRMSFTRAGEETGTVATLEDYAVPVSTETAPTLTPPFAGGIWVAGDGPSNDSGHRRSIFAIDGRLSSPERFAVDWNKVGPNGDSHHDGTASNENWWGYGEPLLAVADGEVTGMVDGIEDNVPRKLPPVTLDNIAGNYVILKVSPTRYVTYAHLQKGSIRVKMHEKVRRGAVLGRLGNSGNSTGAHLHFQVTDGNSVLQSQGVPFVLPAFTYLGPGAEYEIDKHVSVPWKDSMVPGDAVVGFEGGGK